MTSSPWWPRLQVASPHILHACFLLFEAGFPCSRTRFPDCGDPSVSAFGTSATRLLRLDADFADHAAPLVLLGADECGSLHRRAVQRFRTQAGEALHVGRLDDHLVDLGIEDTLRAPSENDCL